MTTLVELIGAVTGELGLNQPAWVVSSTDPQDIQMLALLNRLGSDLCRQYDWQRLNREYVLTTDAVTLTGTTVAGSAVVTVSSTAGLTAQYGVAGVGIVSFSQIQSVDNATQITMTMAADASGTNDLTFAQVQYNLPADWMKQIPQTEWDRTNRWPLLGPQSPQDWQSFKSGIVYAGPRQRFRILGNTITINPPPPDGLLFAYEYVSSYWVESSAGVRKAKFTADDDTSLFPDSLLITGLKSHWKAAKGLDNTYDLGEFRVLLDQIKGQDKSAPKLSLSPYEGDILLSMSNVPDGSWAGPSI